MKKIVLLAVAGMLAAQATYAQTPKPKTADPKTVTAATPPEKGTGRISGVIQDGSTKAPVEFASVALIQQASGKIVNGAITDAKGMFHVEGVAPGQYSLSVSFLSYETKLIQNISIAKGQDNVQVGVVALTSDVKALKEVSVVGEKPLIEDKVDRLVYNAEKDIATGGTAADVMRKVPGLSVDPEGNVQLRGSSNIRVLINNKPSAVMANSVAEAMQQIPADQIKSVEVITSPSARYDAEGTAGIINIITKKSSGIQGLTGSVFGAYGTRRSNVSGNLGYRKGKVGLSSALGYNYSNTHGENFITSTYGPGSSLLNLKQDFEGDREGGAGYVQLGADYDISKTSYMAAGLRLTAPDMTIRSTQISTSAFADSPEHSNTRIGSNHLEGVNYDLNLDYYKTFKKSGQSFSALGLLSRSSRDNESRMRLLEEGQLRQEERNLNDSYNEEITFQSDYTHPLNETQVLEMGAKAILRHAESDYRFLVARPASAPFVLQPERTDIFSYDQDVLASYATYSLKLNKYNLKLGLRYEHTKVQGDFESQNTSVAQDYDNFFPSFSASKSLKENQTLKFNYSKRIQRPQLFFLNPYENVSNPLNVTRGNPNLQAELTDSYEVGYSTFFKSGASVNASVFWHQTNNAIQRYSTPYRGTEADSVGRVTTTFGNIGRSGNYGLSLTGNTKFLEKGRVNSNLNVYHMSVKSTGEGVSNSGTSYNANMSVSYAFPKGLSTQLSGDFNGPKVTLQGKVSSRTFYSFVVKKEVLQEKGTVSIGLYNPFNKSIKQTRTITTYTTDNALALDQSSTWYYYMREIRAGFNYQFGKQDNKNKPRRKKKISNDDAKEGDEDGAQ